MVSSEAESEVSAMSEAPRDERALTEVLEPTHTLTDRTPQLSDWKTIGSCISSFVSTRGTLITDFHISSSG